MAKESITAPEVGSVAQLKEKTPRLYKILLFEFFRSACRYLLDKKLGILNEKIDELLMTRTWQMKMLYLTCTNRITLFNQFNNFEAWRNGAVEIGCYNYLCDGLSHSEIQIFNRFSSEITTTTEASKIYNSLYEMFENEYLKKYLTNTDVLVYISHDLPLWIRTPFETRMNINNDTATVEKKYFEDNYLNKQFSFVLNPNNGRWIKQ